MEERSKMLPEVREINEAGWSINRTWGVVLENVAGAYPCP